MRVLPSFHLLPWRLFKFTDNSKSTNYNLLIKFLTDDSRYRIQVVNLRTQQVWGETLEDVDLLERGKKYDSHIELDTRTKRASFLNLLKDLISPDKPGLTCHISKNTQKLTLEFSAKMNRFIILKWVFECEEFSREESSDLVFNQFIIPTLALAKQCGESIQPQSKEVNSGILDRVDRCQSLQLEYHLLKSVLDKKITNEYEMITKPEFQLESEALSNLPNPLGTIPQTFTKSVAHPQHINSADKVNNNSTEQEIIRRRELERRLIIELDTPKKKRKRLI